MRKRFRRRNRASAAASSLRPWLRIRGYREGRDARTGRRRAELMLSLRGRDYWFPVSPRVYERFLHKARTESRGAGLRYLQRYIRRYREYAGRWPSQRYVRLNRLATNSYMERVMDLRDLASRTGAPPEIIESILGMRARGFSASLIALRLRVGRPMVERVLDLVLSHESPIPDVPFEDVVDGAVSLDEATGRVLKSADRVKSVRALLAMRRAIREPMRPARIRGQKPRSPRVRVTPSTI